MENYTSTKIEWLRGQYSGPVAKLLDLGEMSEAEDVEYAALGIGVEHLDDLLRLFFDSDLADMRNGDYSLWAWLHAGRVIAELRDRDGIRRLLEGAVRAIDEGDVFDYFYEDTVPALAEAGLAALEPAAELLAKHPMGDSSSAMMLTELIGQAGESNPDCRAAAIESLRACLRRPETVGMPAESSMTYLAQMKAVEALPEIEAIHEQDKGSDIPMDSWTGLMELMGMPDHRPDLAAKCEARRKGRNERWHAHQEIINKMRNPDLLADGDEGEYFGEPDSGDYAPLRSKTGRKVDAAKKKAKRKAEKKARKKNKR